MSIANRSVALASAGLGATPMILAIWASLAMPAPRAGAAQPVKAMSTREAREDAVRAVPYAKLNRGARARVSNVLSATTLYRRLPSQRIDCDPVLFQFLIEHPDVVVNIWEVLGISDVSLARINARHFEADDRAGTLGSIEFLHNSPTLHLLYAEGSYEGPLFGRPVRGKVLLLMRTSEASKADGRKFVLCRVDAFLQMEHLGAGMLAKTFQPLVGASADHNFQETAKFLAALNRAAEANLAGMRALTEKLDRVEEADRVEFAELTGQLAARAEMPALATANPRYSQTAPTARKPVGKQPTRPTAKRPSKQFRNPTVRRPTNRRMPG
ncbi:MAG TPA: hypothetical protein VMV69_09050 [Pirellulales bacterium]|nr:hypothetical protein [Pirellulales bacterium]